MKSGLIESLQKSLQLQLSPACNLEELKKIIAERVEYLTNNDFSKLINLLYSIDINETRLKKLLTEAGGKDAAEIIAALIIERQIQKLESRKLFKREDDIGEEERW